MTHIRHAVLVVYDVFGENEILILYKPLFLASSPHTIHSVDVRMSVHIGAEWCSTAILTHFNSLNTDIRRTYMYR